MLCSATWIDVDNFIKIINLTPNVENQDFIQPPSSDDLKEFLLNLGYMGKLPSISEIRKYNNANVDYAAIIWEDLQYQTDYRQTKVRRREIMPYPRFTKAIIQYFMSQHKSISKREGSPYHTIDDDGLLDRLKFISKGTKYQVYRKPIPDSLITNDIKKSRGRAVNEDLPEEPTKLVQRPSK
ncbi:hypothetical protein Tco_1321811 [Tanacetum coccineum]